MEKRVAICISGQPRGLPLSIEKLKWAFEETNPHIDYFLHAWFDEEDAGKPFDSAQPVQDGKVGKWHPETRELLIDSYTPKKYIIEPQKEFPWARDLRQDSRAIQERLVSMFYSIYTCNELKKQYEEENGFKYDTVVRVRYDLVYTSQVRLDSYSHFISKGIITSKKFQDCRMHGTSLTDIFAFGSSEHMDIFSGVYPHYEEYAKEGVNLWPPYGEEFLGWHVRKKHGLPIITVPLDYEIMHRVVPV